MKKQYNLGNLTDSLSSSVFFQKDTIESKGNQTDNTLVNKQDNATLFKPQPARDSMSKTSSHEVPLPVPQGVPPVVPLIPKIKRAIKQRQPFDIYEDQYDRLKKIAETEKEYINGRGMSQMVREAIDTYLKDHENRN